MAATPTVVWKSLAIGGSRESVTRTCAWLAKPAAASRMMERTGVCRGKGLAGESADDTFKFARKRSRHKASSRKWGPVFGKITLNQTLERAAIRGKVNPLQEPPALT